MTNSPSNPEVGEYETHPRANDPLPHENVITFDDEEVTVACRYDREGTFESILDADVAVFCLEVPQKDLLRELLYVIDRTDKHLVVILTNKLLHDSPKLPWEKRAYDPTPATDYHMSHVPESCRVFLDYLRDVRSPNSYNIIVKEPRP